VITYFSQNKQGEIQMAMNFTPSNAQSISRLAKGLFNAAAGNTYMTDFLGYVEETDMPTFADWMADLVSDDAAVLAARVASNVVPASLYTAANDYIFGQIDGSANMGDAILTVLNNFSGMTNHSNADIAAASVAFNASVATAQAYSMNAANDSIDLTVLMAADEVSLNSGNFVLTPGGRRSGR
jgi:hypothetical protein